MDIVSKPLFYFKGELIGTITLSEEESRHCSLSMRMKEGDEILLTNGEGVFALGICAKLHPKAAQISIQETESVIKSVVFRRLCVAPPKTSERFEWMLEKAFEIGVDEILLLETQNSERNKLNLERINKIAVATIKQSKQAYLPVITGIVKWKQFLEMDITGDKFIAHVSSNKEILKLSTQLNQKNSSFTILIGPEGDFTDEEVLAAVKAGYKEVSLGNNVLRTETAAIYALTIFNAFV